MKTYTKIAKDKEYYKTEVEALTLLGDTNIAPQLVDCDEESLRIEMELIELPHLNLEEIYKKGDQAIYAYAKAEYHAKKYYWKRVFSILIGKTNTIFTMLQVEN